MKRLTALLKLIFNAIAAAAGWIFNVLAFPFRLVRRTPTRDLVLLCAAGVVFIIVAVLFLTIKWQPPLDKYSDDICIASGSLGFILFGLSLVGLLK